MKPRDLGLRSDSFSTDYPDDVTPRVIVNVEAYEKVGKTDFSLRDVPDPIIVYNFDQGLEGVVGPLRKKGKDIIIAGVPAKDKNKFPSYHFARPVPNRGESRREDRYLTRVRQAAVPIWERWIDDMRQGYESDCRSMVVDTGGASFTLGKFAFHGMDKVTQKDDPYGKLGGELKAIFQGIIADGYNYDKNVIWIHRLKQEWKGGSPTGGHTADGYNQIGFEVQYTIRLTKDRRATALVKGSNANIFLDSICDKKAHGRKVVPEDLLDDGISALTGLKFVAGRKKVERDIEDEGDRKGKKGGGRPTLVAEEIQELPGKAGKRSSRREEPDERPKRRGREEAEEPEPEPRRGKKKTDDTDDVEAAAEDAVTKALELPKFRKGLPIDKAFSAVYSIVKGEDNEKEITELVEDEKWLKAKDRPWTYDKDDDVLAAAD